MEDRPVLPELGIGNKGDLASIASAGMSLLPSITNARLGPSYDLGSTPLGQNREPEDESVGRALVELKDKGLGTRSGEQPPLRGHERSSAIGSPRQKLAAIQTHSRSMTAAATASPQQSKVNLPGIREFFDGAPNGSLGRYTNGSSQPALSDYARSSRPLHDRQDFRPAQSSPYDARSSTAYARPSPQDTAYHGSSTTSPATTSGIHNARGVYYSKRRSSRGSEHAPTYQTSPSTNGYSTNDRLSSSVGSTPSDQRIDIESPLQSGHTNPTTAPEAGRRTSYSGAYPCDDPGCPAPPFATQYLLNSHKNVHSSVRTHFCPKPDCPRSVGGRGFKRKNEMIRHGLVHDSPGYVCPFCPDKEHRYPRPDNLQRHVRFHHEDKGRDDPSLREVLAQRPQGGHRGRRRRTGG